MSGTLQREFYTKETVMPFPGAIAGFPTIDQGYPLLNGTANSRITNMGVSIATVYEGGQYWIQFNSKGVTKYMGRNGWVNRFDVMKKFSRVGKGQGWNSLSATNGNHNHQGLFNSPQWFRAVNSNPELMGF